MSNTLCCHNLQSKTLWHRFCTPNCHRCHCNLCNQTTLQLDRHVFQGYSGFCHKHSRSQRSNHSIKSTNQKHTEYIYWYLRPAHMFQPHTWRNLYYQAPDSQFPLAHRRNTYSRLVYSNKTLIHTGHMKTWTLSH